MFTKNLMSTAELSGVLKDQKRKPLEREVDKDLTPACKRFVPTRVVFFLPYSMEIVCTLSLICKINDTYTQN